MSLWIQLTVWVPVFALVYWLSWRKERGVRTWFVRNKGRLPLGAYCRVSGLGSIYRLLGWSLGLGGVGVLFTVWQGPLLVALACIAAIGGFVDVLALRGRRRRRLLDAIRRAEFRVCACCLYSLIGHGRTGRCPECGEPYDVSSLTDIWERLLSKNGKH